MLRALVPRALVPRTLVPRLHPCQGGRIENPGTDQGIPDGTSRDPVSECQDLYADETMSQLEKMESLLPYIQRWIQNEPQNPLKRSFLPNDSWFCARAPSTMTRPRPTARRLVSGIAQALASTTSFMKSL